MRNLFAILIVLMLSGCMSLTSTFSAREYHSRLEPMAGTRTFFEIADDPVLGGLAVILVLDLPFSFIVDIGLLPITGSYTLIRKFFERK